MLNANERETKKPTLNANERKKPTPKQSDSAWERGKMEEIRSIIVNAGVADDGVFEWRPRTEGKYVNRRDIRIKYLFGKFEQVNGKKGLRSAIEKSAGRTSVQVVFNKIEGERGWNKYLIRATPSDLPVQSVLDLPAPTLLVQLDTPSTMPLDTPMTLAVPDTSADSPDPVALDPDVDPVAPDSQGIGPEATVSDPAAVAPDPVALDPDVDPIAPDPQAMLHDPIVQEDVDPVDNDAAAPEDIGADAPPAIQDDFDLCVLGDSLGDDVAPFLSEILNCTVHNFAKRGAEPKDMGNQISMVAGMAGRKKVVVLAGSNCLQSGDLFAACEGTKFVKQLGKDTMLGPREGIPILIVPCRDKHFSERRVDNMRYWFKKMLAGVYDDSILDFDSRGAFRDLLHLSKNGNEKLAKEVAKKVMEMPAVTKMPEGGLDPKKKYFMPTGRSKR